MTLGHNYFKYQSKFGINILRRIISMTASGFPLIHLETTEKKTVYLVDDKKCELDFESNLPSRLQPPIPAPAKKWGEDRGIVNCICNFPWVIGK